MITFSLGFICQDPLNIKEKLSSGAFPIPVSFIYGDLDWVKRVEKEGPDEVIAANPNAASKYYLIPDSDHNLHMDQPLAFANCIINDLLGENLEV
jgi:pimeloyl-ACP methyl ester carboxylesterase